MSGSNIIVRGAKREDVPQIMALIRELAEFEKMPEAVKINEEILEKDGFDTNPPPFVAYVVEDSSNPGVLIGYALCNLGYATWVGKRFYIEDIMVTEKYRGAGVGTKLFSHVCKEALRLGCVVINFVMIDWNPAAKFYKKMGAIDSTETIGWHWNVIHKADMEKVAAQYKE
uniref:Diamine acetyltransferase 2 n=1 Tax=Lygus hesperus TaxID=30085 RepID=A0A0A9WNL3_LYGHE